MAENCTLWDIFDSETPGCGPEPQKSDVEAELTDLAALTGLSLRATCLIGVSLSDGSWKTVSFGLSSDSSADYSALFSHLAESPGTVEIEDVAARTAALGTWAPPAGVNWVYGSAVRDASGTAVAAVVVVDRTVRRVTGPDAHAIAIAVRRARSTITMVRPRPYLQPAAVTEAPAPVSPTSTLAPPASPEYQADSPLLRTREVAKIFDVTERTVLNWVAAGRLPSLRTVGGHLRFRQKDLDAVIAAASVCS